MANGYNTAIASYTENAPILDVIYALESSSGTNKKAYVENEVGALGGYQIRRSTYKDIQRINKDRWGKIDFETVAGDDRLSRLAANDYVNWIEKYYTDRDISPSVENILLGYHSGVGNVRKGNIGKEGKNYIKRAHDIMFPGERVE